MWFEDNGHKSWSYRYMTMLIVPSPPGYTFIGDTKHSSRIDRELRLRRRLWVRCRDNATTLSVRRGGGPLQKRPPLVDSPADDALRVPEAGSGR